MNTNKTDELVEAVMRGYQKIEAEQQRKEAEEAAYAAALRYRWDPWIERARERVPEVLRPYFSLSTDPDQTYQPPQDQYYYYVIFNFPGMMAPIRVNICLQDDEALEYEVPGYFLDDDNIIRYSWYRTQRYTDLDIALAMASEEGIQADQTLKSLQEYHRAQAAPEPTYEPVDQAEIVVNNPLVSELADFIRGIVDEQLSERMQ